MAEIKWLDDSTIQLCLSVGTQGTTLTSIAAGAYAISNATGDLDNGTELDLFADFELACALAAAPDRSGAPIADLYVLPSVDGTNFPNGSVSQLPDPAHKKGTFIAVGTGTTQRAVIEGIDIGPRKMRFFLHMHQALSSGTHTLKAKTYKQQDAA